MIVGIILANCSQLLPLIDENTDLHGLSRDDYHYVLNESQAGGNLDFGPQLGNKTFFLIDDILYSRNDAAIFTWGQSVKKIGVPNAEQAVLLYEQVLSVELREPQIRALIAGYSKEKSPVA